MNTPNRSASPVRPLLVTVVLVLAAVAIPLVAQGAQAPAQVRLLPETGAYFAGQEIDVQVQIADVSSLWGADVRLLFDATRLQVIDANPALSGVQIEPSNDFLSPDFVLRNEVDNTLGSIWYAAIQLNPSQPVTGTGILCTFTLQVTGTGGTTVTFSQANLSDRFGTPIPANPIGATYRLSEAHKIFVPLVLDNASS